LEWAGAALGHFFSAALIRFLENIEPGAVDYLSPVIDEILQIPDLPASFRGYLEKLKNPPHEVGAALLLGLGGAAGSAVVGSVMHSLLAPVTYEVNKRMRPARPTPLEAFAMWARGWIDEHTLNTWLWEQGWPDAAVTAFKDILRPRPEITTLLVWAYKVHKTADAIRDELKRRGYTDHDINTILEASKRLPGASDLVTMALREAFDDNVAAKYGYDAELSGRFIEEMKRQGFDDFWARMYWRAHWRIPSPDMAYRMLQRQIISLDEARELLRLNDYPPYWRDKLIQLAYSPYTRVDIRRMYRVGVLKTKDELVRAYRDLGYDIDKANKLADFTILEYADEDRNATKADIAKAYELGRFDENDVRDAIAKLGYPSWVADVLIARVDTKIANERANKIINWVHRLYVSKRITRSDAVTYLSEIPLSGSEIERYLDMWDVERRARASFPTKSELKRFFIRGIITEQEYRAELASLGYSSKYIDWYVADAYRDKRT